MRTIGTRKGVWLLGLLAAFVGVGCEWDAGPRASTIESDGGPGQGIAFRSVAPEPSVEVGEEPADPPVAEQLLQEGEIRPTTAEADLSPVQEPGLAFLHVDEQPADHLKEAERLIQEGDMPAALTELGKALYDEPTNLEAALLMGKSAWKNGDMEMARKAYRWASEIDPARAEPWIQLGRMAMLDKRSNRALELAQKAIALDPKQAEAHNLQGRVWLERSHWHRAVAAFHKARKLAPQNQVYRNNLGYAYLLKKEFGNALEVLEKLVEEEDVPAYIHNNLGLAYEGVGRLQEAISSFRKALKQNPGYVNAKINLDRLVTLAQRSDQTQEAEPQDWEEPLADPEEEAEDLILIGPDEL